jgi:hypothetical protein
MSQTDAQNRDTWAKGLDNGTGETCFVWCTGSRRDDDMVWLHALDLIQGYLVVSADLNLRSLFRQILVQVVRKAIVIIKE